MRSSIVCSLIVGGVLAGAAFAAEQRPVEPGGKIGVMTVVRGDTYDADVVMVQACPSLITKPGKYHRSCSVPKVPRLHIGESHFAQTQKELDISWKRERWSLWVDGRPVDLPRFGTSDSNHYVYGKPAFFRRWRVILAGAPSGRHTIHYLLKDPSGTYDVTTTVTVGK
jgi:hypothetical protein